MNLNGWEITGDPVESGGLVDQDRIVVTPEGMLVLPLTRASTRRAEVAFSLRRAASPRSIAVGVAATGAHRRFRWHR